MTRSNALLVAVVVVLSAVFTALAIADAAAPAASGMELLAP